MPRGDRASALLRPISGHARSTCSPRLHRRRSQDRLSGSPAPDLSCFNPWAPVLRGRLSCLAMRSARVGRSPARLPRARVDRRERVPGAPRAGSTSTASRISSHRRRRRSTAPSETLTSLDLRRARRGFTDVGPSMPPALASSRLGRNGDMARPRILHRWTRRNHGPRIRDWLPRRDLSRLQKNHAARIPKRAALRSRTPTSPCCAFRRCGSPSGRADRRGTRVLDTSTAHRRARLGLRIARALP